MPTTVDTIIAQPEAGLACDVCPHPRDSHDRIGARFCAATAAAALDGRGCVCVLTTTNQARTN